MRSMRPYYSLKGILMFSLRVSSSSEKKVLSSFTNKGLKKHSPFSDQDAIIIPDDLVVKTDSSPPNICQHCILANT